MANEIFNDVRAKIAEAKERVQEKADQAIDWAKEAKKQYELTRNRPVWASEFEEGFELPDIIHVDAEPQQLKEPVCEGAVAFRDGTKEKEALVVLPEFAKKLDAVFYPALQEGVYIADPYTEKRYIDLNDYFYLLKDARVHELNKIAESLGATYVKITLQAERKEFIKKTGKAKIGPKFVNVDMNKDAETKQYDDRGVTSETRLKGHEPHEPELVYFKNDTDINTLVEMRMKDAVLTKTLEIKYNSINDINEKEALKIDGVLKKLKVAGAAAIAKEVSEENRYRFKYEIKFEE